MFHNSDQTRMKSGWHTPEELDIVSIPLNAVELRLSQVKIKIAEQLNIIARQHKCRMLTVLIKLGTPTAVYNLFLESL